MDLVELRCAIGRQRPGWSLEQQFYVSPSIYEVERRGWLAEQWYVLGHCSEIAEPRSYMVRDLLGESLIVVRNDDLSLRGLYNVCRHRGSRICDSDGRAATFNCPYHGWSYRLDGSLRSAPAMSAEINKGELGLKTFPVREIGGLILGSLTADPATLDEAHREAEPLLNYQGIPDARIAARRRYPIAGNWKLVMENAFECYHCLPAHPEYSSVMRSVDVNGRETSAEGRAVWDDAVSRWFQEVADPDSPGRLRGTDSFPAGAGFDVWRAPVGGGRKTQSSDGEPVAPLMGRLSRFDGGVASFVINPFVFIAMPNDHAILFQFLPIGPESTDVTVTWLVNGSAPESKVDADRMLWLWDITTAQDKQIIERNASGVRSRAYAPGPYSTLEAGPAQFIRNYLEGMARRCGSDATLEGGL